MGKTHRASPSYNGKKQKRGMPSSRVKTRSHGSTSDFSMDVATYERELKAQLASMGLYASNTVGDGNCMFRALSDQLYGTPKEHMSLRREICDYLDANIDVFEFFVDDGRPFAEHMRAMRENGTWGGHLELTAFARLKQKWIKVVQPNLVYVVSCKDESPGGTPRRAAGPMFKDSDVIYLAFHNYEHWSSVRNLAGPHAGPPSTKEVPRPSTSFSPTRSSTSSLSSPPSRSVSPTLLSDKPSEAESLILSSIPPGSASLIQIREITGRVAREETDGQTDDVPWERVVEVVIDQLDKDNDGDKEMIDLDHGHGHNSSPTPASTSKASPPSEKTLSQETVDLDREDRGRSVLSTLAQREGHPYPWRESSPVPSTDGSTFGEKGERSPSVASPRVASSLVADAATAGPGSRVESKRGRKKRSPSASASTSVASSRGIAGKKALLPRKQPTRTSARIRSSLIPTEQGRSEVEGSSPAPSLAGTDVSVSSTGSSFVSGSGSSVSSAASSAVPPLEGEAKGTTAVSDPAPGVKTATAIARPVDTTYDDPTLASTRSILINDNSNRSSSDTRPARPRQKRSLPSSLPGSSALSNGADLSDSTLASSNFTEYEDDEDGNDSTTSSFVPSGPKSKLRSNPSGPSGSTKVKKAPTGKEKRSERRTKVAEARAAMRLAVATGSAAGEGEQQSEKTLKKRKEGKSGERMMTRSRKSLGTEPRGEAVSKEVGKTVVGGFKELFI